MTPGQHIRQRRKARGWTQAEAASRLGRCQSVWSDLERDEHSPTVGMLERVAAVLGCSVADLLPVSGDEIERQP